ncbi:tumor susceptibility gene 101 protein-like isoform X1 [Lampetra fluviatilis]
MAQGSEDALRPLLRNYRFRDLTLMEVRLAGARYAELHPGRDVYVATNGIDKNLLHLSGTIPVIYEGFEYNMPVRLWLPESFPYSPPLAFVQPTQDMILNPGHHVDSRGRVYLPYLQHWTHVRTPPRVASCKPWRTSLPRSRPYRLSRGGPQARFLTTPGSDQTHRPHQGACLGFSDRRASPGGASDGMCRDT